MSIQLQYKKEFTQRIEEWVSHFSLKYDFEVPAIQILTKELFLHLTRKTSVKKHILKQFMQDVEYPSFLVNDPAHGLKKIIAEYSFQIHEQIEGDELVLTPEILSFVYENLFIEREDRKISGSFYTPPLLVDRILNETLWTYLTNKVEDSNIAKKSFKDRIRPLIFRDGRAACYLYGEERKEVIKLLENAKTIDLSVGCGAFLVGYLDKVSNFLHRQNAFVTAFFYKNNLLRNCLYGVDIKGDAVLITKARLLISLLSSYKKSVFGFKDEEILLDPLPTLQENFQVGNALIDPLTINKSEKYDFAIGNPPFVRPKNIDIPKQDLQESFPDLYTGSTDLSVYFYKKGLDILKEDGLLAYISSKAFVKSLYGRKLRNFLYKETQIELIADGQADKSFDANIDPDIFIIKNKKPNESYSFRHIEENENERLISYQQLKRNWIIETAEVYNVITKMDLAGKPLIKEYPHYTGLNLGVNKAFVVTEEQRQSLINEDPNCESVFEKVLRGRDIKDWFYEYKDEYIINLGSTRYYKWPWSDATTQEEAENIFSQTYPSLFKHLYPYKKGLLKVQSKKVFYFEGRPCSYQELFKEPKIVYAELSTLPSNTTFDNEKYFLLNSCQFLVCKDLYILALLNCRAIDWCKRYTFSCLDDPWKNGSLRHKKNEMEEILLPICSAEDKEKLDNITKVILQLKKKGQNYISPLENQVNQIVYKSYNFTDREIDLIEGKYND